MELPAYYNKLSPRQKKEVREQYVRIQLGKCYHCGAPLDGPAADHILKKDINLRLFPPNFLKYPIHLHHCHDTGMTIGAVHCHCNAVLWQYLGK
jgi:hypothetical protein